MILMDRPLANDHVDGPASCKWSSGWTSLLQMIIRMDLPLANDHPDGPASCKWSSGWIITYLVYQPYPSQFLFSSTKIWINFKFHIPAIDSYWGQWGSWSACSKACWLGNPEPYGVRKTSNLHKIHKFTNELQSEAPPHVSINVSIKVIAKAIQCNVALWCLSICFHKYHELSFSPCQKMSWVS